VNQLVETRGSNGPLFVVTRGTRSKTDAYSKTKGGGTVRAPTPCLHISFRGTATIGHSAVPTLTPRRDSTFLVLFANESIRARSQHHDGGQRRHARGSRCPALVLEATRARSSNKSPRRLQRPELALEAGPARPWLLDRLTAVLARAWAADLYPRD
jgi:hypothetical protein